MKIYDRFGRAEDAIVDHEWRGTIYPTRLPALHRLPPPDAVVDLVRWFWIPEWHIAPGRVARQELLPFVACNLVVEEGFVGLSGPATGRSFRDLEGDGWAVGALLRPAAVPHFTESPRSIRDTYVVLDEPELRKAVVAAMTVRDGQRGDEHRRAAVDAFSRWILASVAPPTPAGLQANALADLIDFDPEIATVEQIAERLRVSVRTVQRIAARYFGCGPLSLLRRRRLQAAAELLRDRPDAAVGEIAASLGYSDQAHLANDFRDSLDKTPSGYRKGSVEGEPLS